MSGGCLGCSSSLWGQDEDRSAASEQESLVTRDPVDRTIIPLPNLVCPTWHRTLTLYVHPTTQTPIHTLEYSFSCVSQVSVEMVETTEMKQIRWAVT